MALEHKDKDEVRTVISEVLKKGLGDLESRLEVKIDEKLDGGLTTAIETLKGDWDKRFSEQEKAFEVKLESGQKLVLGRPGTKAPAFMRPESLGDRPYSIGNIVRVLMHRDESYAPLEIHVSKMLEAVGYGQLNSGASGKRYLVPISPDPRWLPINEEQPAIDPSKLDGLRLLLKDCLVHDADPYEMKMLMQMSGRSYNTTYGKAMDPLDETLGGTLLPYPERGTLLELLRAVTVVAAAGAQQIALPPGGIDYPKENGVTNALDSILHHS